MLKNEGGYVGLTLVKVYNSSFSAQIVSFLPRLHYADPLGKNTGRGIVSSSFKWLCTKNSPNQFTSCVMVSKCSIPSTLSPSSTTQISPKMSWQLQATPIWVNWALKMSTRVLESNWPSSMKSQTCSSMLSQFILKGIIRCLACLSNIAISLK